MNIFGIQAKQEDFVKDFVLGTYFLDEKRKFLNTIQFFNYTKKFSGKISCSSLVTFLKLENFI